MLGYVPSRSLYSSGVCRCLSNSILSRKRLYSTSPRVLIHEKDGATVKYFPPAPSAPRLVPTPLVTISASGLESLLESEVLNALCEESSLQGFASFQCRLPYVRHDGDVAKTVMDRFAANLRSLILSTEFPFPPVLFAYRLGSLIAQTYVSSYPVSALILDDPTPVESLASCPGVADKLPLPLDDFNFEPKFPLLVIGHAGTERAQKENRLVKEGAEFMEVARPSIVPSSPSIPPSVPATLRWLEEMGF